MSVQSGDDATHTQAGQPSDKVAGMPGARDTVAINVPLARDLDHQPEWSSSCLDESLLPCTDGAPLMLGGLVPSTSAESHAGQTLSIFSAPVTAAMTRLIRQGGLGSCAQPNATVRSR
jgi:hypothetical protein